MVGRALEDRRIRELRPDRPAVDPWVAHGSVMEDERRPDGTVESSLTVFLSGSECPFACSFCDLWRWTIDGPTPPGAIPAQLEKVLASVPTAAVSRLKLYNASNFFDPRAVPVADWPRIAALASQFSGITVESHARTVGTGTLEFAHQLDGRLEVAMGLETIHPIASKYLNKRLDLPRFDRAAEFLGEHSIDLRVFVLVGAPYTPLKEYVESAIRTAEYAVSRGAAVVALIPVRGGNGEMERLQALGHFTPPTLRQLELALDGCLHLGPAVVTADLWDVEKMSSCAACQAQRAERLGRINLTGESLAPVVCSECAA